MSLSAFLKDCPIHFAPIINRTQVSIELDSIFLQKPLVNPFSKTGSCISLDSGWVSLADSLEFYSYAADEWPSLKGSKLRANFLKAHSKKEISSIGFTSQRKVPDWIWYGLFVTTLTLIWLEPKVLN